MSTGGSLAYSTTTRFGRCCVGEPKLPYEIPNVRYLDGYTTPGAMRSWNNCFLSRTNLFKDSTKTDVAATTSVSM